MKTKEIKEENKTIKDFTEKEWNIADLEHYGEPIGKKITYNIVALNDNDEIMGRLNSSIRAGVMQISTVLVAKDKQGQKVGTGLMLKVEEFAKKHGAHKIFLKTGKGWVAEDFYKALGYKITSELFDHFFHQDFVIFTKFLKQNHGNYYKKSNE